MKLAVNRRSAIAVVLATFSLASTRPLRAKTKEIDMDHDLKKACSQYISAWQQKDLDAILTVIDKDVRFISPNATTSGRDAYRVAAQRFLPLVESVSVNGIYYSQTGAMFDLTFNCVAPVGACPTAERVTFKDGLIVEDELFFDARPFEALMRTRVRTQLHQ